LDFELDKAYARCGEEGRRRTPWGLVQEYLNASEDRLWGVVSNGLVLRILRDNPSLTRPAWIELDLERTFEDEVFSDFAAFWLLAHGSRFLPREAGRPASCILEHWRAKAHETGERARAQLRKGVETALLTLGNGFVRHPANDALRRALQNGGLKPADLHQQLLRLVYRCLFLLTVEDRDLLHPPGTSDEAKRLWREGYSLGQLRERALRPAAFDGFSDLWHGLAIAFTALHQGAFEIGAPALDSALFDWTGTPDLHAAQLANRNLLGAIKALSFFTPVKSRSLARINYRDMNTEEFGSVYEGLLELHPHVDAELWKFGYVGHVAGNAAKGGGGDGVRGSERKLSGSYYTPSSLVQELIKSALEPVMIRAMTDQPYDRRAALLGLKVIDPACGSGHFLLAAARKIAASVAEIEAAPDAPTEAQRQHALREVVRHCIYGVDRNPLAVELCKTALWIETVEPGRPLSFLDHRIRMGDSLIGVFDLSVLEEGIPEAAYTAKTGDDKAVARDHKSRNREERKGQQTLAFSAPQI
ncbi:MAG: N-6 DNA methylase, partial [Geminicoccales bacterium]